MNRLGQGTKEKNQTFQRSCRLYDHSEWIQIVSCASQFIVIGRRQEYTAKQ
jgi:hypothetical protein